MTTYRAVTELDRQRRRNPLVYRLQLAGLFWLYVLMFPATIVVFVLIVVGIGTAAVTAGVLLLLAAVPLARALSGAERAMAGVILDAPLPSWYRRRRPGGVFALLRGWATDPARWRDLLLLFVSMTAGFVLAWVAEAFLFLGLLYLIWPLLFAVTPKGVFDTNLGIIHIDTQAKSFLLMTFGVIGLIIWWYVSPPLMRARARMVRGVLSPSRAELERRVAEVSQSRAESVDYSAAELRRIERDLHDGAQARLVSLGMSLGLAEDLMRTDPEAAARLLVEARHATTSALGDLRTVVRGIHPPVLADRGLGGAVQALALDVALPVYVTVDLPGRPPPPVESAAYFAVAECLANVLKHAGAEHAWVTIEHSVGQLRLKVIDDGHGGADATRGSGLAGMSRRLGAFDGTMVVDSPLEGPTIVTLELPCELSLPRT